MHLTGSKLTWKLEHLHNEALSVLEVEGAGSRWKMGLTFHLVALSLFDFVTSRIGTSPGRQIITIFMRFEFLYATTFQ